MKASESFRGKLTTQKHLNVVRCCMTDDSCESQPSSRPTNASRTLHSTRHTSRSPLLLPPGELLPGSHPADEDEPNLLLVPGLPVFSALGPPGGAVPAERRRPPVCHGDQRLRCGHGREKQLLWGVSHQLEAGLYRLHLFNVCDERSCLSLDFSSSQTQKMKNCDSDSRGSRPFSFFRIRIFTTLVWWAERLIWISIELNKHLYLSVLKLWLGLDRVSVVQTFLLGRSKFIKVKRVQSNRFPTAKNKLQTK